MVPLLVLMARQLGVLARTHPPADPRQPARPLKATADLYDKTCSTLQQVHLPCSFSWLLPAQVPQCSSPYRQSMRLGDAWAQSRQR